MGRLSPAQSRRLRDGLPVTYGGKYISGSSPKSEHGQMIEDCKEQDSKLTNWERSFIHSVSSQSYSLTEKQVATLENIHRKVTGG